jgi:uncharacterized protein YqfA (UPF0365 family)
MRAIMEPRDAYLLGVATTFAAGLAVWLLLRLLGPWLLARAAGGPITLAQVFGMRMRGSEPRIIVGAWNALRQLGEDVPLVEIEAAYLGLPPTQRDVGTLALAVRPGLGKREGEGGKVRQAGGAA